MIIRAERRYRLLLCADHLVPHHGAMRTRRSKENLAHSCQIMADSSNPAKAYRSLQNRLGGANKTSARGNDIKHNRRRSIDSAIYCHRRRLLHAASYMLCVSLDSRLAFPAASAGCAYSVTTKFCACGSDWTYACNHTLPSCRELPLPSGRRRHHCTLSRSMLHVYCKAGRAVCRREPRHCICADITRLSRSCVRLVAALGMWASCPSSAVQVFC